MGQARSPEWAGLAGIGIRHILTRLAGGGGRPSAFGGSEQGRGGGGQFGEGVLQEGKRRFARCHRCVG